MPVAVLVTPGISGYIDVRKALIIEVRVAFFG